MISIYFAEISHGIFSLLGWMYREALKVWVCKKYIYNLKKANIEIINDKDRAWEI